MVRMRFQQQYDPTTERLIFVSENLKNTKTWSFTLGMPFDITPWWSMRINATYYCQENNGYINQELSSIQQNYAQVNTNQSFQLPLDFSAELAFVYTSPSLWGKNRIGTNYNMTIGLQKQLGEKGGTVRFNITDALNSNMIRLSSYEPNQSFVFNGDFDLSQRTFSISYTRNFGNNKIKASRKRTVGASEELKRTN